MGSGVKVLLQSMGVLTKTKFTAHLLAREIVLRLDPSAVTEVQ